VKVCVVGAGGFGTAIAQIVSRNVDSVTLIARNPNIIRSINEDHENPKYHPGVKLKSNIKAEHIQKAHEVFEKSDFIFMAVPSGSLRNIVRGFARDLKDKIIISGIKGIEYPSLKTMTEVIREETGSENVFSMSGPTFAVELIRNVPSGLTIGSPKNYWRELGKLLESPNLFLDYSENVKGVEFCGILKNVYAVAMGILDNYILGENDRYLFLNICFKEMSKILHHMGYEELLPKFCGFGDFILTACSSKSRNKTLGLMLGKRMILSKKSSVTIESLKSIKAVQKLVSGIKLPALELIIKVIEDPNETNIYVDRFFKNLKEEEYSVEKTR